MDDEFFDARSQPASHSPSRERQSGIRGRQATPPCGTIVQAESSARTWGFIMLRREKMMRVTTV